MHKISPHALKSEAVISLSRESRYGGMLDGRSDPSTKLPVSASRFKSLCLDMGVDRIRLLAGGEGNRPSYLWRV